MTRAAAAALLLTSACIPSEGPMMAPFQDCVACHDGGNATRWTVAGTWRRGAKVDIVDANGKTVPLRGNDAGNFYTAEGLAFPVTVSVDGVTMPPQNPSIRGSTTYGGCNLCHRAESFTTTFDANMLPGIDCLWCHAPGGMAKRAFSSAGTFEPGRLVDVDGNTTTTNSVGNFFFDAATTPIDFRTARPASVGGSSMEGGTTYGGCNSCHGSRGSTEDD